MVRINRCDRSDGTFFGVFLPANALPHNVTTSPAAKARLRIFDVITLLLAGEASNDDLAHNDLNGKAICNVLTRN